MTKLLVTLDGSTLSEQVIPHAATLAERLAADVHLVIVASSSPPPDGEPVAPAFDRFIAAGTPVDASVREAGSQALGDADLESYLKERALSFDRPTLIKLLEGDDTAEAIVDYVRREGIDYVAMATHGRGGLSELLQGSVAGDVVRAGEVPVFLVRPTEEG
jgi:nucleotide-binding universal stress UspA family protein